MSLRSTSTCDIEDPITREIYNRDPRQVAKMAERYLQSPGSRTRHYFGPEAEFYIFNDVRYDQTSPLLASTMSIVTKASGMPAATRSRILGYKIPYKRGYFPVPPNDSLQDLRTEMMLNLIESGIEVEMQHHEVALPPGEIDMKFNTLLRMAGDDLQKYKYIIKNTAVQNGYTVTFMPKPLFSGQRLRHARTPVALEGRASRCFSMRRVTVAL